jgi:hypothetical protein
MSVLLPMPIGTAIARRPIGFGTEKKTVIYELDSVSELRNISA